jgi:hypothetical protein
MAVGYNYKITHKKCWFNDPEASQTKVTIPFKERSENMNRKAKWHVSTVEDIFENHHTIVAFHMKYLPRVFLE